MSQIPVKRYVQIGSGEGGATRAPTRPAVPPSSLDLSKRSNSGFLLLFGMI